MRTKRPRRKGGPERLRPAGGRGVSDAASEDEPGTRHGEACSWGGVVECTGSELTPPTTTGSGLSDPEIPFNSSVSQSLMVPGARIPRRGCLCDATAFLGVARASACSLRPNVGAAGCRSTAPGPHRPRPSPATSAGCAPSTLSAAAKPGSKMSPDGRAAARPAVTADPRFLLRRR